MSEDERPEPLIEPEERTVTVDGRATLIRLERAVWDAFDDICRREEATAEHLCMRASERVGSAGLDQKIAEFCTGYFRDALRHESRPPRGMSEGDGEQPAISDALAAAFDAVGLEPDPES